MKRLLSVSLIALLAATSLSAQSVPAASAALQHGATGPSARRAKRRAAAGADDVVEDAAAEELLGLAAEEAEEVAAALAVADASSAIGSDLEPDDEERPA